MISIQSTKRSNTSACVAPRSVNNVVICGWKSNEAGCFRRLNNFNLTIFRTLVTWESTNVGGKLTWKISLLNN